MTSYRLAKDDEIPNVIRYLGNVVYRIGWPTVIAEHEGKILGVFSTHDTDEAIIAGPIKANTSFIALRLVEAYENVMKFLGIAGYMFSVGKSDLRWLRIVRKFQVTEFQEDENLIWFRRRLK